MRLPARRLKLRDLMSEHLGPEIPTSSTRAGYIPGTHRVGFDSEADQILLTHTARSRQGFASGALLAAHWIIGRTGVFEFGEVIEEILAKLIVIFCAFRAILAKTEVTMTLQLDWLRGCATALVTPFTAGGAVDESVCAT